jgi:hypothetical protein
LYSMTELNADVDYSDLQGAMHYVGLDFKNGNAGIQGSGTVMTSALEIDYTNTPNTGGSGKQTEQHDMLFYVSISKMLSIGSSSIVVSF